MIRLQTVDMAGLSALSESLILYSALADLLQSMTMINGGVWGLLASYGVYLSYYLSHDTFEGTSDLAYAFIGGVNFAAAMLVAPGQQRVYVRLKVSLTQIRGQCSHQEVRHEQAYVCWVYVTSLTGQTALADDGRHTLVPGLRCCLVLN